MVSVTLPLDGSRRICPDVSAGAGSPDGSSAAPESRAGMAGRHSVGLCPPLDDVAAGLEALHKQLAEPFLCGEVLRADGERDLAVGRVAADRPRRLGRGRLAGRLLRRARVAVV